VFDPNGQLITASFMNYAMAAPRIFRCFRRRSVKCRRRRTPLGLRGAGEGGITPALGVVANASVDGLLEFGITHVDLPATPERIWRTVQEAQRLSRSDFSS
jgi:carbon-monoxide dehydrogenase large subunit